MSVKDDRPRRGRQAERSEATRSALVSAARGLFGERGYADVAAEEIVRAAGVTRGALYHHFGGKRELLEAVYREVEEEVTRRIAERVLEESAASPLAGMRRGAALFIEVCAEPEVQRIVLLDAPAVLGWDRWREIAAEYGLGLIEGSLTAAMEAGELPRRPIAPLAHVLIGALDEAAMYVARADDPAAAQAEVYSVLESLLAGVAEGPGLESLR
ncbi:MAG TPA: helix-turn-helix domain-containing protein [Solirubrobacterales bacterium]|nr:helix-turn-helix domain-containing protein [Solirubrobacterales bacterium]